MCCKHVFTFFFFNDTATTEIYTLSLHDALPIFYQKNLDEGVAGFWNDMNEPGVFLSDETPKPDIYHHPMKTFPLTARHAGDGSPGTHARYHNVYGMQMARATFEGLKKLRPGERPFVLTRAGYAGVQRFSAVWTGDNVATWDHLRLSLSML